jgi:hypothetical protein
VLNLVEKLDSLLIRFRWGKTKKEKSHPMKKVIRIGTKRKPKVTPQEMALMSSLKPLQGQRNADERLMRRILSGGRV